MKLKFFFIGLVALCIVFACGSKKNVPDVSHINVDLKIERFDEDFFKVDTNNMNVAFDRLNQKYHNFLPDYLFNILGLTPPQDSILAQAKLFLKDSLYHKVFEDASTKFINFREVEKELKLALQLTKYYFPNYQPPSKIYTFIGPIDGVATAITSDHNFAVGLQGYLGKDYPAYQLGYITQIYPAYKTRKFEEQYIATNCIKSVMEELYPNNFNGRPLAERIIEEGKRMYLLDALLPYTADSIKTGYTQSQLEQCLKNEKNIWAFFVSGNLLFEREPSLVSPYVTDGPKTQELSESAPGNIGMFSGWQIVKKWMKEHPKTSLQTLMQTNAMSIFNEVGYSP
ncbi:MAG: hypothetical protein KGZ59_10010 [Chitinophagaceae bacterium]|nr:hypothetical protein [Chitinophagaceae bacterium]